MKHTHIFPKQNLSLHFWILICLILIFIFLRNIYLFPCWCYSDPEAQLCSAGGEWAEVAVNGTEENYFDLFANYIQEFGLWRLQWLWAIWAYYVHMCVCVWHTCMQTYMQTWIKFLDYNCQLFLRFFGLLHYKSLRLAKKYGSSNKIKKRYRKLYVFLKWDELNNYAV